MNCLGSQSQNYAPLPEDSDSTLPPTSASESASTDNLTPSTATTASAGDDGAAAGASDGIALPPAVSVSPSSRLNVAPSRGRSSSARGRRSNGGGAGHPFHHSHHHAGGHGYHHLKDTVVCPTCRGQGKVPKEKEGHLVALIPADDERLRPSKTKTYVFIAIVISLLLAFLTIFFIYPRSFELTFKTSEPYLYPTDLYINTTADEVRFKVQHWWYLVNPNYYPIQLQELKLSAVSNKKSVAVDTNRTVVSIPLRSKLKVYATLKVNFTDGNGFGYYAKYCNDPRLWVHTVYMTFQATAVVNIFGYNFTVIVTDFPKVSCGRDVTTTVSPPTTTSTTTTSTTTTSTTTTSTTTTSTTTTTTTSSTKPALSQVESSTKHNFTTLII